MANPYQQEIHRLRAALEEITDPIPAMKKRCEALGDGNVIDGYMAVTLANDANNLKIIAKKALAHNPDFSAVDAVLRAAIESIEKVKKADATKWATLCDAWGLAEIGQAVQALTPEQRAEIMEDCNDGL